ncbi:hypothetical protein MNEG_5453, partial [Monoraphidium neglectum]
GTRRARPNRRQRPMGQHHGRHGPHTPPAGGRRGLQRQQLGQQRGRQQRRRGGGKQQRAGGAFVLRSHLPLAGACI